jgi:hypothetical protein
MAKQKIHFERVPIDTVRKIAKLDSPNREQDGNTRRKREASSEKTASTQQAHPVRPSETP